MDHFPWQKLLKIVKLTDATASHLPGIIPLAKDVFSVFCLDNPASCRSTRGERYWCRVVHCHLKIPKAASLIDHHSRPRSGKNKFPRSSQILISCRRVWFRTFCLSKLPRSSPKSTVLTAPLFPAREAMTTRLVGCLFPWDPWGTWPQHEVQHPRGLSSYHTWGCTIRTSTGACHRFLGIRGICQWTIHPFATRSLRGPIENIRE